MAATVTATGAEPATLDAVAPGTTVVLGAPDLPAGRIRRLAEFGLRAGQRVTVLHRTAGGGRLLAVGDARVAVDVGLLRHVPVRPVPAGTDLAGTDLAGTDLAGTDLAGADVAARPDAVAADEAGPDAGPHPAGQDGAVS
ncbi:MAG: ferrous iron transport protein A [Candidatus Nanopelagicales bacterium]